MPTSQGSSRRRSSSAPPEGAADRALASAAELVGDRWSLLVVSRLLHGPRRFGELLAELDGLAPNILSKRLSRLEAEGLVVAEPYSRRPVRHSYRLTASGAELAGALRGLAHWGAGERGGHRAGDGHDLVHGPCGTPVEARWFCPTCDQVVDDPGDDGLRWV